MRIGVVALLLGTFISTMNANIPNVPMREIAAGLHTTVAKASLSVIVLNLLFAAFQPLGGWLGNRFGRRRAFVVATGALGVTSLAAMFAPNIESLIAIRAFQGAANAAVTPVVMAILAEMFGPKDRARALSGWATANGVGQAFGPPLGGVLAGLLGWRWIFAPTFPVCLAACLLALWFVPDDRGRPLRFAWQSAAALTSGATVLLSAFAVVPYLGAFSPGVLALIAAALALFGWFVYLTRTESEPFVSPRVAREPSYVRSAFAGFAQMFCVGASLLGAPLFITHGGHVSAAAAGLIVFPLPLAMALLAPFVGQLASALGAYPVLRIGLAVIAASEVALALAGALDLQTQWIVMAILLVLGAGIACVQTASATAATSSEAGRYGAGVGLFNLIRFTGSTSGGAWVAIVLSLHGESFGPLFALCAAVAACGFAGTFAGRGSQLGPAR
jgi:MFS family permease